MRSILMLLIAAAMSSCVAPQAQGEKRAESALVQLTRGAVIQHARAYVNHRWSGTEANVFHGEDRFGNRIDTPDALGSGLATGWATQGEPNQGVSYQWGGFSSIAEFEAGVAEGKWAGHLPTDGRSFFTPEAVGVDCSGLVSRIWRLPRKESTRSLPRLCRRLDDWDDLLPGDILNRIDRHTMVFVEWEDPGRTQLRVIESTAREGRVHESVHERLAMERRGYQALRYPPLAH